MIEFADSKPQFEPGMIVRHRRYHYRGVIVAFDMECRAPAQWYEKNQTQPLRHQPWYHVLVHATGSVTYAAQDNLLLDDDGLPISHPLLEAYFDAWENGRYLRNATRWESW